MDRRWMLAGVGTCLGFGLRQVLANQPIIPLPLVRIALSPTCGCCKDWVAHLHANASGPILRKSATSTGAR